MQERRNNKTDILTSMLRIAATLGWLTIVAAQFIVWKAAPEMSTGIVRYHELELRETWQASWVALMPFVLGACTILSLFALGLRPFRSRRKSDPKRVHLLILLGLTLGGYILYWFQILENTF